MIRKELRKMGVTGYSIHGLRKNAGNALAEAEGTEHEIRVTPNSGSLHQARKPEEAGVIGRREAAKGKAARLKWQTQERNRVIGMATPLILLVFKIAVRNRHYGADHAPARPDWRPRMR